MATAQIHKPLQIVSPDVTAVVEVWGVNSGRIGVCRLENAQVKQTMTGSTVTLDILENIGGSSSGNSTTASAGASVATPGADKSNGSTESGTGVAWEVKQVQP